MTTFFVCMNTQRQRGMCAFFTHTKYNSRMAEETSLITDTSKLLLATFRKLIKPMIRLFLAKGNTYTLLLEEIKRTYVEVADEEFKLDGRKQTDSRITLLTGVHRRDVHRIRSEEDKQPVSKANFSAQIIAQWIANPRYLDSNGKPKALAKTRKHGGKEETFESLVATVSKDIRSRPVLDEWLRTEIVSLTDEGYVQLNTEAFIPNQNLEEQLFFLGMNVHDHLAAAVNNTLQTEKMFERCVYYDQLTQEHIQALHAWVHVHAMDFLKAINQQAMQCERPLDNADDSPVYRMNSGIYFYFEPSHQELPDE